jgi:hypothetical protein
VEENPFRRLMGLAKVRVVVAGRAGTSRPLRGRTCFSPWAPRARGLRPGGPGGGGSRARPDARHRAPFRSSPPCPAGPAPRFRAGMAGWGARGRPPRVRGVFALGLPGLDRWHGGRPSALWVALGVGALGPPLAEAAWRGWDGPSRGPTGLPGGNPGAAPPPRSPRPASSPWRCVEPLPATPRARHPDDSGGPPPLEADPRALDLDRGVAEALQGPDPAERRPRGGRGGERRPRKRRAKQGRRGVVPKAPGGMFKRSPAPEAARGRPTDDPAPAELRRRRKADGRERKRPPEHPVHSRQPDRARLRGRHPRGRRDPRHGSAADPGQRRRFRDDGLRPGLHEHRLHPEHGSPRSTGGPGDPPLPGYPIEQLAEKSTSSRWRTSSSRGSSRPRRADAASPTT